MFVVEAGGDDDDDEASRLLLVVDDGVVDAALMLDARVRMDVVRYFVLEKREGGDVKDVGYDDRNKSLEAALVIDIVLFVVAHDVLRMIWGHYGYVEL